MKSDPFNILVFDSGAGGLSIAREILHICPYVNLHYLADKAFFPYGNMEDEPLKARVIDVIRGYVDDLAPEVIVIACNTVSTLALADLRRLFPGTLFVGVVPAVKPAALSSGNGCIGVLATPATIQRHYTHELVENHASQQSVYFYGSCALVTEAENYLCANRVNLSIVENELNQLLDLAHPHKIDTVVLACTHFPLLREHLENLLISKTRHISFIDSGEAVARRLLSLLTDHFPEQLKLQDQSKLGQITINPTGDQSIEETASYLNFLQ